MKPTGSDQRTPFSQNASTSSYVPQVQSNFFTHPLLAVNIDHVDESVFDWSDPERSHSYYDLTRDAEQLLGGNEDMCHRAFGQIRHWPPGGFREDVAGSNTKSALRKFKDNSHRRNVSWSSKVTCKTYSKDDPNSWVSSVDMIQFLIGYNVIAAHTFRLAFNNRMSSTQIHQ